MKTAILLCGQARYARRGYESIKKHILDIYTPDVYIHTWKSDTGTFEAAPWNNLGPIQITESDIQEYIELYNPVKFQIDTELDKKIPLQIDPLRTSHPNTGYNFYSYLVSLRRCYELVENPNQYDTFIVLRSDIKVIAFPRPSKDKILIWNRLPGRRDVIDVFVCCVPTQYIDTYTQLVYKTQEYHDMGYYFNYEELYHAHFVEQNLYSVSTMLSRVEFEWAYYRGDRIEFM
jgi:hypothetical protein